MAPGAQAAEGDWVLEGESPGESLSYAGTILSDGRIFASMGYNLTRLSLQNDTWLLDPATMEWTRAADSPNSTEGTCAVSMPDGMVYLFGGSGIGGRLKNVLIYDVEADSWSYGPALPKELVFMKGVAIDETTIMLAGGATSFMASDVVADCYLYDITAEEFTSIASLPEPRSLGGMVYRSNNVYYIGGSDSTGSGAVDVYVYELQSGQWYNSNPMPEPLVTISATVLVDGSIVILGGGPAIWWYDTPSDHVYLYNPSSGLYTRLPDLPEPVRGAGLYELEDGRVMYLLGNNVTTPNKSVRSLLLWEIEVHLTSSTVAQGDSTWMSINIKLYFQDVQGLYGTLYLVDDNVTFAAYEFSSPGHNMVMVEMPISEMLPAGDYQVLFGDMRAFVYWGNTISLRSQDLTVTEASSTQDQLDGLEEQNQDLMDRLDDLEQQNQDLSEQLDDAKADLQEANDAKLDATIGYAILVLVLATLVVGIVVLVRKK